MTTDHVPFVYITILVFSLFMTYQIITGFVTRVRQRVPLVKQELLTLPGHLSSHLVFNAVRVARSLIVCVMFCRSSFVVLSFLAIVSHIPLRFTTSDVVLF